MWISVGAEGGRDATECLVPCPHFLEKWFSNTRQNHWEG